MATTYVNGPRVAGAYETISTLTAATSLTAATYNLASASAGSYDKIKRPEEALISVETAAIRWTCDGTTPTVTAGTGAGHYAAPGDSIVIVGNQNIAQFKAINEVASNGAAIRITYSY